jgi:HKD family nuclease
MRLLLHAPQAQCELSSCYKDAFKNATELFIASAYLTEWDEKLELNPKCGTFRFLIGKDFGITKKDACRKVMRWLPRERKHEFLVADQISGFHPKSLFWKEENGRYFAIIGSSNLTLAAFSNNYEANVLTELSESNYLDCKKWLKDVESLSRVVEDDWLNNEYEEYKASPNSLSTRKTTKAKGPQILLECPANSVPVGVRQTGMEGALDGARKETYP